MSFHLTGERAIPASELNRRASYDFYASERARAGLPEFLRERASQNSALWSSINISIEKSNRLVSPVRITIELITDRFSVSEGMNLTPKYNGKRP